ncbi:MAG: hypothetical protein WBE38_05640 [Terracidiphilus sp.]
MQSKIETDVATIVASQIIADEKSKSLAQNRGVGCMKAGIFTWLFGSSGFKSRQEDVADPSSAGTAEDYEEFIGYLRGKDRAFSKPGRTIKEEFKFWLADRNKKQAASYNSPRPFAAVAQK